MENLSIPGVPHRPTIDMGPSGVPGGGVSTGGNNEGENHEVEDAIANRMYYRTESLSSELISSAENPGELFRGIRQLEKQLEDASIPFSLSERYTPPRELAIMYERADILRMTPDELTDLGMIKNYNQASGEAMPAKRKYASLALSVEEKPVMFQDERTGRNRQVDVDLIYNFGTPEKRAEMSRAFDRAVTELEARSIMDEHISLRLNLDFRDNLEGLVSALHGGRMPKFKAEHLEAIFNMPGLSELTHNPENKRLGDQVERAMFLNLVMLNSGNKTRMQNFLERPGAKFLIAELAKEKSMTVDAWIKENIGDVDGWVGDIGRDLGKTWRVEADDGRRGKLTKWSNISAWGGKPSEFGADKEKDFIEGTVGNLVGSNEAAWVAATLMRSIGAYASEGYVALPNGKSLLPLGEGRYISGDDTGKFYTYMFNMKEGLKGRASGLKDMIGKIPDMAMNLFDWAGVEMSDLPPDSDGAIQKRSIWDAWLGTVGGKPKLDLLTMQPTNSMTTEEPYHRLGSLNYKSLERDFHGTFSIMQWLMGNERGPVGVFIDAMKVEDFKPEDFTLNELKKRVKYIGIVMNPVVMTKGSTHLYEKPDDSVKIIQKNFLRNLMLARIHSAAFSTKILNGSERLFNPEGGGDAEVPDAVLIRAFIKEALKNNPKNEDGLKLHYIDDNKMLRTMGRAGLPGIRDDKSALLDESFEPEDPTEKMLVGYVGKVTGKNT